MVCICIGASIGYYTGDPLRLLDDAQTLKPEFLLSVPRVLNKIYQGAMVAGDVPTFRGAIFRKAVAVKLERLHTTGINIHPFWDKLVFRKVGIRSRVAVCFNPRTSRFELCLVAT